MEGGKGSGEAVTISLVMAFRYPFDDSAYFG